MVDQRRIDDQRWVDSRTAAKHLGIQQRTLYAYVSRGQVRSVAGEHGRPRLYSLADLERLRVRRDARAGHGAVAAGALRWGEPVLDSAITAITPRGPAYRGRLATELAAAGARFENVAELLWSGYLPSEPVQWPRTAPPIAQLGRLVPNGAHSLDVMPVLIEVAALADPQRRDGRPDAIIGRGRALIPVLAAALAPDFAAATVTRALGAGSVAVIAARALGLDDSVAPIFDCALVLLADHELNASSFTARVAASTDADPYACVAAALATLSGPKHGSASELIARFADEVGSPEHARAAIRALRKKGEVPPGFGHPLYPAGDPRSPPLVAITQDVLASTKSPYAKRARTVLAIIDAVADAGAQRAHERRADRRRRAGRAHGRTRCAAVRRLWPLRRRAQRRLARARARATRCGIPAAAARALHGCSSQLATPFGLFGSNSAFETGSPRRTSVRTVPAPATYGFGRNRK